MTIHQISAYLKPQKDRDIVKVSACRHGKMMYLPNDIYIGAALDKYGEYIEGETQKLCVYLNAGDVVVEVGSNIGAHTVPLARKVTDAGRVFAFEPQRIMFQMLCGNLALNSIWNVQAARVAVSNTVGVTHVPPVDYSQPGNFGCVSMEAEGEPVATIKLDDYGFTILHLLKVDVEGMERDVLEGATDTIKRLRPIIYVENDRREHQEALCEMIEAMDYEIGWHLPPMFSAGNYRNDQENIFQAGEGRDIRAINMLCFPKERGLKDSDCVSRKDVRLVVPVEHKL